MFYNTNNNLPSSNLNDKIFVIEETTRQPKRKSFSFSMVEEHMKEPNFMNTYLSDAIPFVKRSTDSRSKLNKWLDHLVYIEAMEL